MISAVVITARGGHLFTRCLHSLRRQTTPFTQIIVVHSFPCIREHLDVQYLHTEGYHGYAHAVNHGTRVVSTPYFLVLNDDTVLHPTCNEELKQRVHPNRILQPQIRQYDRPHLIENTGHWITKDGFNMARGRNLPHHTSFSESLMVFSGAAFCAPKSMILHIGPMDIDLFSFGEDLDWSLRAIRSGYNIHYIDSAIVHHTLGGTHGRAGFHKGRWVERNRICAIIRSWPQKLLLASPYYTVGRLTYMLFDACTQRGPAQDAPCTTALGAFTGYAQAISMIKKARIKRKRDQQHWRCSDEKFLDMIEENTPPRGIS